MNIVLSEIIVPSADETACSQKIPFLINESMFGVLQVLLPVAASLDTGF